MVTDEESQPPRMTIDCHQRGHFIHADPNIPDRMRLVAPDGRKCLRPVFRHQPAMFGYDEHGYERIAPTCSDPGRKTASVRP